MACAASVSVNDGEDVVNNRDREDVAGFDDDDVDGGVGNYVADRGDGLGDNGCV